MKDKISRFQLTALSLIVALLLSFLVFGTSQDEDSAVAVHMKAINQGFRELRRQLSDPDKTKRNLVLVAEIKKHLLGAQKETPSKALDLPESERGPFLEAFRAQLDEVVSKVDELEKAIKENRTEEASALVKQLNDLKKKGHTKFQD